MRFIKDLLSETGAVSTTRFVHIAGLLMAFAIAVIGINKGANLIDLSVLCLSFIIPQTIAKVMQKRIEVRGDLNEKKRLKRLKVTKM